MRKRGIATVWLVTAALTLPVAGAVAPAAASHCPTNGAKFEPADGKVLMIIGQDRDSAVAYVNGTGVVPGGFMTYTSINGPVLGLHLPFNFGGTSHGQHFVDNYPNSAMQVGVGLQSIDNTILGLNDVNIDVLGDWIKAANRPVFVRIGYEFDGDHNAYDPVKYVQAYRRIVDRLRARGVTNAAYVWHSASKGTYLGHPMSAWYPGDGYVDWTAVSIFHTSQLFFANQMADFADAHGKPIMIAESTPHGYNAAAQGAAVWTGWHTPVLDFINSRGVKAWSYINQNWEQVGWPGWGDSRVESNASLKSLWLGEITQPRYLNASASLFCGGLGHG